MLRPNPWKFRKLPRLREPLNKSSQIAKRPKNSSNSHMSMHFCTWFYTQIAYFWLDGDYLVFFEKHENCSFHISEVMFWYFELLSRFLNHFRACPSTRWICLFNRQNFEQNRISNKKSNGFSNRFPNGFSTKKWANYKKVWNKICQNL